MQKCNGKLSFKKEKEMLLPTIFSSIQVRFASMHKNQKKWPFYREENKLLINHFYYTNFLHWFFISNN
jgi:hypothetical protein